MGPSQIHIRHRVDLPRAPHLPAPQHALLALPTLRRVPAHRLLAHPISPEGVVDRCLPACRGCTLELGSDRGLGSQRRICLPEGVCGVFLCGRVRQVA